jgi:hypothetical protein
MGAGSKKGIGTPPAPGENRLQTEKMICKSMNEAENDQNHKKESTPFVDNKPNGKSRVKTSAT